MPLGKKEKWKEQAEPVLWATKDFGILGFVFFFSWVTFGDKLQLFGEYCALELKEEECSRILCFLHMLLLILATGLLFPFALSLPDMSL